MRSSPKGMWLFTLVAHDCPRIADRLHHSTSKHLKPAGAFPRYKQNRNTWRPRWCVIYQAMSPKQEGVRKHLHLYTTMRILYAYFVYV